MPSRTICGGKVARVQPNEDVQNVAQVISSNSIEFLRQNQTKLVKSQNLAIAHCDLTRKVMFPKVKS